MRLGVAPIFGAEKERIELRLEYVLNNGKKTPFFFFNKSPKRGGAQISKALRAVIKIGAYKAPPSKFS
jgi:hypothetical protein